MRQSGRIATRSDGFVWFDKQPRSGLSGGPQRVNL